MHISKGITMLPLSVQVMGGTDTIYPVLIWDDQTVLLTDTGYPGQLDAFKEAFQALDIPWSKLGMILITHQDLDHIGSLPAILADRAEEGMELTVLAHEIEKPYIEGHKMLLKHTPDKLAAAEASLPPQLPEEWKKAFLAVLSNPPKGRVDRTVTDGEILPIAGGVIVIHTPGHSPGHLALYHPGSRTLIAGDALTVQNGNLEGPHPEMTPDMDVALASLHRFTEYEIDHVICYHGGLYRGEVNARIAELAQGR